MPRTLGYTNITPFTLTYLANHAGIDPRRLLPDWFADGLKFQTDHAKSFAEFINKLVLLQQEEEMIEMRDIMRHSTPTRVRNSDPAIESRLAKQRAYGPLPTSSSAGSEAPAS